MNEWIYFNGQKPQDKKGHKTTYTWLYDIFWFSGYPRHTQDLSGLKLICCQVVAACSVLQDQVLSPSWDRQLAGQNFCLHRWRVLMVGEGQPAAVESQQDGSPVVLVTTTSTPDPNYLYRQHRNSTGLVGPRPRRPYRQWPRSPWGRRDRPIVLCSTASDS